MSPAARSAKAPEMEVFTWTHPRRSSDCCFVAEHTGDVPVAGWYGVADMIGRPTKPGWGRYLRSLERQMRRRLQSEGPADAAAQHALLRRFLEEHNRYVYSVRSRHDDSAFGFCICIASLFGRQVQVHWLGDCRAYRLRRVPKPAPHGPAFEVHALTRDHNALDRYLREKGKKAVFFQNEMLDLGKRLEAFLGLGQDKAVHRLLESQAASLSLEPNDCLLLITDGFFMPLARDLLAVSEGMDLADLYLETWLARLLEREADGEKPGAEPAWPAWIAGLTSEVRRTARLRPEYRDDIALLGLFRP